MLSVHTIPYVEEIRPSWLRDDLRLFVKREDLIHPEVSGNKWRKLDKNLEEAVRTGAKTLVTFGGAYSNHIYATAAAARETGMASAGIIRGESSAAGNPTLAFARSCGMKLVFADRSSYRDKEALRHTFSSQFEQPYFLPEGGSNCLAVSGCRAIVDKQTAGMDVIVVAAGTGGTMAGIIAAVPDRVEVLGISTLKGDFLAGAIANLLKECQINTRVNWHVDVGGHCGGYARITEELIKFIRNFREECGIWLDPVYTGKMMFRIKQLVDQEYFSPGARICAIHTGGMQGWKGIYERYGICIPGLFPFD